MAKKYLTRQLPLLPQNYKATVVFVKWLDSAMVHEERALHELPDSCVMYSAGILLAEDDDKITFSADSWKLDNGEVMARQITTVPKVCIYEIKRFTA